MGDAGWRKVKEETARVVGYQMKVKKKTRHLKVKANDLCWAWELAVRCEAQL